MVTLIGRSVKKLQIQSADVMHKTVGIHREKHLTIEKVADGHAM